MSSKSDKIITECVMCVLSSQPIVNIKNFCSALEEERGIKREEVGKNFQVFHDFLKEKLGVKHYAIDREILSTLNCRALNGTYKLSEEAEAYLRVSNVLLEEGEAQLTKNKARANIVNYALYLRKLLDENKMQEKKLKEAERLVAIGQTAGMVGHDLRNPLQTIIGEIYLAKKELSRFPELGDIGIRETLDAIAEQVFYMNKIVSDLQAFVKPVSLCLQTVLLRQLLVSILAQVGVPDNVNTRIEVDDALTASADAELLRRVFVNLVTNALQAMPDGGEITVAGYANGENVRIMIEDTGVGIPDSVKSKLFTPLFTTKAKGQGFGLAVCKRVIEAHGGSISFESQEGKGAKFSVLLPLKKDEPSGSN